MDLRCDFRAYLHLICSLMKNLRFHGAECQPLQTGVQSLRCGQVRNLLSSLGALRSWTTMEDLMGVVKSDGDGKAES